jgi:hypothetical protein
MITSDVTVVTRFFFFPSKILTGFVLFPYRGGADNQSHMSALRHSWSVNGRWPLKL